MKPNPKVEILLFDALPILLLYITLLRVLFSSYVGITSSNLGRETKTEVILRSRLLSALTKLNPDLETDALTLTVDTLTAIGFNLSLVNANQTLYKLLKEGVKIQFRNAENEETEERVNIIDWQNPENNDFFLTSQFWIVGETYTRRTDLIGFINGIPLVFIELKSHKVGIEKAFEENFTDYKQTFLNCFGITPLFCFLTVQKLK